MAFLTYGAQISMLQDLSKDTSASMLATFQRELNNASGMIFHQLNRYIYEEPFTLTTVAQRQAYQLPVRIIRLSTVTVTSGNLPYVVSEVPDRMAWLRMNQVTQAMSTYPQFFFIERDTISFFPPPSGTGNKINIIGEVRYKDMTQLDYTTGSVLSVASGDTVVTFTGTNFDSTFAGRYLRITNDGHWYKIKSVTNTTTLVLFKNYEGTSITSGTSAYTIGQQSLEAYEDLHLLPVWFALAQFYAIRRDFLESPKYMQMWTDGFNIAKTTYIKRTSTDILPSRNSNPPQYPYGFTNTFPQYGQTGPNGN